MFWLRNKKNSFSYAHLSGGLFIVELFLLILSAVVPDNISVFKKGSYEGNTCIYIVLRDFLLS